MPNQSPIVTFSQLNSAFNSNESVPAEADKIVREVADNELEAAMLLSSLGDAMKIIEASEKVPGVLVSPDHKFASLLQTFIAANAKDFEEIKTGGVEAKFDNHDVLGWLRSIFSWFKGFNKHDWLTATDEPVSFSNEARLGLLGDWGTGLYGAPECSRSLANDPKGYQLLFHLGDVYYSGDTKEVEERFLNLWAKNDTTLKNAISRACNSNHEMYTGGNSYFDLTLKAFDQSASYFALQNDYWILAGLDSAYFTSDVMHNKADLNQEQVDWLDRLVAQAGERKIILFSHHQPLSYFDGGNPRLTGKLDRLLTNQKIFAWYWGHEHRCILYDQHPVWKLYGRCAGHSGFPYFRDDVTNYSLYSGHGENRWLKLPANVSSPGAIMIDGPNPFVTGEETKYGVQGYMTLEFSDRQLNEIVHAPDGTVFYEQRLI